MVPRESSKYILFVGAVFLAAIVLPFLLGRSAQGENHVFGGILLNPLDGNTYLAKMYQGFRGDTIFTLPYSSDPGSGAYINMFYVVLGHVARMTGISLVLLYNLARVGGAAFMFYAIARMLGRMFPDQRGRRLALWLTLFGSGMGWVAALVGLPETADFWVAEAYPFLSAYTNPHFPLGLGLIVWLLTPPRLPGNVSFSTGVQAGLLAFLLALVSPFGVAIVLLGVGGVVLFEWWETYGFSFSSWKNLLGTWSGTRSIGVALGGGSILVYDLIAIEADPVLRGWNAQNITTSPTFFDLLLSFSPLLVIALFGAYRVLREKQSERYVLLAWFVFSWLLVFFPFDLQRRFLMGIFIPVAALAVIGLEQFMRKKSRSALGLLLFLAVIPTNILVLFAGQFGVQNHAPLLYLYSGEADVFEWIEENTAEDVLILAAPETGLFVPAYTGRRVIYGHPFETVNAAQEEAAVIDFFTGSDEKEAAEFLREREIDFVFVGPRETALGVLPDIDFLMPLFTSGDVKLFRVGE